MKREATGIFVLTLVLFSVGFACADSIIIGYDNNGGIDFNIGVAGTADCWTDNCSAVWGDGLGESYSPAPGQLDFCINKAIEYASLGTLNISTANYSLTEISKGNVCSPSEDESYVTYNITFSAKNQTGIGCSSNCTILTCLPNQTIMKISNYTNAHGALWDVINSLGENDSEALQNCTAVNESCESPTPVLVYSVADFAIWDCSGEQNCSSKYNFSVSLPSDSLLRLNYTIRSTHCSSVRIYVFVDGTEKGVSEFLGYPGSTGLPFSTLLSLPNISSGSHNISVQAEGQIGGCNVGWLGSWGGSIFVESISEPDEQEIIEYIPVCYSEIFGTQYNGTNPHDCTGSNRVLSLFQQNNSPVAINNLTGYNVPVCYGNLNCVYDLNSTQCVSWGGRVIASLYQQNNSYISLGDFSNYSIKICCKQGIINSSAYWQNLNNQQISSTPLNVNVRLIVSQAGIGNVNYTIEKKDGTNWNSVISMVGVAESGLSYANWLVSTSGVYRFRANVPGFGEIISPELNASGLRSSTIPQVDIVNPICGSDFWINQSMNITLNASDPYDLLVGELDFGDGVKVSLPNANGINIFVHNYSTSGTKKIVLTINDTGEPSMQPINKATNVIIIDNETTARYLAGCIESPRNAEVLNEPVVDFSASTTRAFYFYANNQSKGNISLDTIRFNWTISNVPPTYDSIVFLGDSYFWKHSVEGLKANVTANSLIRGYRFDKTMATSGQNWARLSVEFSN